MDLNLISPINFLGYGYTGMNILKALRQQGHKISLFPIGPIQAESSDAAFINQALENARSYNPKAPSLRLWHAHDMTYHVGKGLHCGWPIFELTQFKQEELYQLACMDKLIVCSKWAKSVVENHSLPTPFVVPLGVDINIFRFDEETYHRPKTTTFFNCGKWELRKGHDVLVQAFNKAFGEDDDVKLIMNCYNPFLSEADNQGWAFTYLNSKLGREGKIIVNNRRLDSQYELARQMEHVDCGVFPSRAEGWNLEPLELMAMGKHVILTNYSAHTAYANKENSLLIDLPGLESAVDKIWFFGEGKWGYFNEESMKQLINYMRDIHWRKQDNQLSYNKAGIMTASRFTWSNTASKLVEALC